MLSGSRRHFLRLTLTTAFVGAGGLLAACQAAAPAAAPTSAPPAPTTAASAPTPAPAPANATPGTTGASPLKGTKLTILAGNSYVPAQDGELDDLVTQLNQNTGMEAHIERYAGEQMRTKLASVVESGGADLAVLIDTDAHLYRRQAARRDRRRQRARPAVGRLVRRRQAGRHRQRQRGVR